jgi:hypothetical protein
MTLETRPFAPYSKVMGGHLEIGRFEFSHFRKVYYAKNKTFSRAQGKVFRMNSINRESVEAELKNHLNEESHAAHHQYHCPELQWPG